MKTIEAKLSRNWMSKHFYSTKLNKLQIGTFTVAFENGKFYTKFQSIFNKSIRTFSFVPIGTYLNAFQYFIWIVIQK